jgi:hypothetical protein
MFSRSYANDLKDIDRRISTTVKEQFLTHIEALFVSLEAGWKLSRDVATLVGIIIKRRDQQTGPDYIELQTALEELRPRLQEQKRVARSMEDQFGQFLRSLSQVIDSYLSIVVPYEAFTAKRSHPKYQPGNREEEARKHLKITILSSLRNIWIVQRYTNGI